MRLGRVLSFDGLNVFIILEKNPMAYNGRLNLYGELSFSGLSGDIIELDFLNDFRGYLEDRIFGGLPKSP